MDKETQKKRLNNIALYVAGVPTAAGMIYISVFGDGNMAQGIVFFLLPIYFAFFYAVIWLLGRLLLAMRKK